MPNTPDPIKQHIIEKAIRAAQKCGWEGVRVRPNGDIMIVKNGDNGDSPQERVEKVEDFPL